MAKPAKLKPELPEVGTRIEVLWADCFTVDSWTDYPTLLGKRLPTIATTGYFLGRTDDGCWVVSSGLSLDGDEVSGGATWFIPSPMITSWESTES